jgi:hypothetical protein
VQAELAREADMERKGYPKIFPRICATAGCLFLSSAVLYGQEGRLASASSSPSADSAAEVRALSELIRDLQGEVQSLNAQLGDLRAEQARAGEETRELRRELDLMKATAPASSGLQNQYGTPMGTPAPDQPPSPGTLSASQGQASPDRLGKLEEDDQVLEGKVNDVYQTKVESGSKYRLRLSGIILLNLYGNRGSVDNQDFPLLAEVPDPGSLLPSPKTIGGSLRQSQIRLQTFGPDIGGARTSADLNFDFAGGFPPNPNGATMGLIRLRTGTLRLDWSNTSVIGGQDRLFFVPLAPTSLATLATPALAYAGDLWAWTPQLRVEHRIPFSDSSNLSIQAGILDSLTWETPDYTYGRNPSWGELSGQPAYAVRIGWSHRIFGQNFTVGAGGYYGRQNWGLSRNVDGWAGTADLILPLGKRLELTSAFYRGRAVAGIGGGIGQDVLLNGSSISPATTFRGLDSIGGWAQLKVKVKSNIEVNGALGIDNPFASELRKCICRSPLYSDVYTRNLSPTVNIIYQMRSDILISAEFRHFDTTKLDSSPYGANHVSLSLGYIF